MASYFFEFGEIHAEAFFADFALELYFDEFSLLLHFAFQNDAFAKDAMAYSIAWFELLALWFWRGRRRGLLAQW